MSVREVYVVACDWPDCLARFHGAVGEPRHGVITRARKTAGWRRGERHRLPVDLCPTHARRDPA